MKNDDFEEENFGWKSPRGDDPMLPFIRIAVWQVRATIASFFGCGLGGATAALFYGTQDIPAQGTGMLVGGAIFVVISTIYDTITWGWWDWLSGDDEEE